MRVLIADNHPLFRGGLRRAVEDLPGFVVVGEAADGPSSMAQAGLLKPDLMTVDLNMPNSDGFEVVRWMRANLPDCLVIIVSMHAGKAFVEKAVESGAHGFIAKEDAATELATAFAACGEAFFMSSSAGRSEPPLRLHSEEDTAVESLLASLTPTEKRVLRLVARSSTSREVAEFMGIAERTIHSHRNNICVKLNIRGTNGLLSFAVRHREAIFALEDTPGRDLTET